MRVALFVFTLAGASVLGAAEPAPQRDARLARTRADLASPKAETRRAAIGVLIHSDLSLTLRPEMQKALTDPDWKVREAAATALGNLGAEAIPAVPALLEQLRSDPQKEPRETAARALGRIGKAAPAERRALAPLRRAAERDADSVTRVVALGALAQMEVDLVAQIAALHKFLRHDDALTRMKAAHALGMIGAPARAASADIATVLQRESDAHRRGYVARALGNVGDPAALPALYAALEKETYEGAKGEMRGAIARLGGKVP